MFIEHIHGGLLVERRYMALDVVLQLAVHILFRMLGIHPQDFNKEPMV